MTTQPQKLSASQEDYLEAIFNLSNSGTVARSKDIAEAIGVAKSSVTGALRVLAEKQLINYKPYGHITLTETGLKLAAAVAKKHDVIESFFVDVLGVEAEIAQKAACRAEHSLGPKIVNRLLEFIEFVTHHDDDGVDFVDQFQKFCSERTDRHVAEKTEKPLSTIPSGSVVTLAGIDAGRELKSRLAAMGMIPNVEFKVITNNASGPFVVSVKGSKIVLGRSMVHKITVR
jgi:DtxR family Mn-dependent transcriptional regulator